MVEFLDRDPIETTEQRIYREAVEFKQMLKANPEKWAVIPRHLEDTYPLNEGLAQESKLEWTRRMSLYRPQTEDVYGWEKGVDGDGGPPLLRWRLTFPAPEPKPEPEPEPEPKPAPKKRWWQ